MISDASLKLALEVVDNALAQLGEADMLCSDYDYTIKLATAGQELTAELESRGEPPTVEEPLP